MSHGRVQKVSEFIVVIKFDEILQPVIKECGERIMHEESKT